MPETLRYHRKEEALEVLDQRALPFQVRHLRCRRASQVAEAIESMAVRGAPAIGLAAAFGLALEALHAPEGLPEAAERLARSRPTAVNLFWALERMRPLFPLPPEERAEKMLAEAETMLEEDRERNRRMGAFGASLLPQTARVITHCNAGALATGGFGTALGVLRAAREQGKELVVYADETRPRLQGARLTAFELFEEGFSFQVLCDGMAAALMRTRGVDAVITGADRIARNGDCANKIGTYGLAICARHHRIPKKFWPCGTGLDDDLWADAGWIPHADDDGRFGKRRCSERRGRLHESLTARVRDVPVHRGTVREVSRQ